MYKFIYIIYTYMYNVYKYVYMNIYYMYIHVCIYVTSPPKLPLKERDKGH